MGWVTEFENFEVPPVPPGAQTRHPVGRTSRRAPVGCSRAGDPLARFARFAKFAGFKRFTRFKGVREAPQRERAAETRGARTGARLMSELRPEFRSSPLPSSPR